MGWEMKTTTKRVSFKRKSGRSVSFTPGKERTEPKRLPAIKGAIVGFEIDERPYHREGEIIGRNANNPRHEPRYIISVWVKNHYEHYHLYRDEFEVIG